MTLLKKVSYAFLLCAGLTYIGLKISWPDTEWFNIFLMLQFTGFIFLLGFLLLFSKLFKMGAVKAYLLATLCAYVAYLFVMQALDKTDFSNFIVKVHTGKDFIPTLLSFLLANTALLIFTYFEERSKSTQKA